MPSTFGNYVVRPSRAFGAGEPTQMSILAELMLDAPEVMRDCITRMFTATVRPTFTSLLKNHTTPKTFKKGREITWQIAGTAYKHIKLIEARKADGTVVASNATNVGRGGEHIFLLFPEKYFFNQETIVGSLNEYYQFKIYNEPEPEGTNWRYEVELMAGAETGIAGEYLQAGEPFSYEFLLVEDELSEGAGGIRESTPSDMRNEFSTMRKQKKFTGGADWQQQLGVTIPVMRRDEKTGNVEERYVNSWFTNEEWIFFKEWEEEHERVAMFSRSNRNSNGSYFNTGRSGNVIREGNGLFAQMEYGNAHYYNATLDNFDLSGLESALYDVCEKGNVPMNERVFVITTGNRGMAQAHTAIEKDSHGWTNLEYDSSLGIVSKVKNEVHQTSLAYGAQFVEKRSPNGLVMKFVYEPAYDDPVRNKIPGPDGKGVLNSYRYDIWDMGSNMEPNMYLCNVENYDNTAKYIIGIHNPWGIKGNIISRSEDSATIEIMDMVGAIILDSTRCLTYAPAGLFA